MAERTLINSLGQVWRKFARLNLRDIAAAAAATASGMSLFANKARLLIDNDGKFARAVLPRFGARARCADGCL